MMTYKTILSGSLEFGTPRSFKKVVDMVEHRIETYYKREILVETEELFDEESLSLIIPRLVTQSTNKTWKNTINLLRYIAEFAMAGSINAWMVENGKIIRQELIEPKGDKVAIQAFIKGRELVQESGMEVEAMKALSRAIDKFARHASAYERRGYVNFQLRNYDDALYDFTKSININQKNPDAYWGRANVKIKKNDWEGAISDLGFCIKQSIPLQPIYWEARRTKGDLHFKLEQFELAATEYKFFTKRQFAPTNPNYKHRKNTLTNYGKVLLEINKVQEAIDAFNAALKIEEDAKSTSVESLLYRGLALKKAGKKGFKRDWKEAAQLGSKKALELLDK